MTDWNSGRARPAMAILALLGGSLIPGLGPAARAGDDGDEFFEKTIRPILINRCQNCHGGESTKGGLKLTSRDAVLKGGDSGPAAVPTRAEESLIIQAIRYQDEPRMPPKGQLPAAEIAALARWVDQGLSWPSAGAQERLSEALAAFAITDEQRGFWAFRPVARPEVPAVRDRAWARNDLDRFVLARLEAEGLHPAAEADRHVLIRRATFDLTGLPPTPDEVAAFLNDPAADAFDRLVDRLLASPAYGERWARHWLDVVRYADSLDSRGSGQPGDILDAWRYRDWVVDALNRDMPYDRFARMQIAGDLMPPEPHEGGEGFNRDGTIATTMLAIGNWGNGDADKDKILTDIADDQVDVVSKAFLGLTVSCARCHDHKFDPISQKDYYGLAGIFFSTHILPKLTPKGAGETILRVPLASPAELERRRIRDESIAALDARLKAESAARYGAFARSRQAETARYLLALADYEHRPADLASTTLADFAKERGLMPYALARWADFLGLGGYRSMTMPLRNLLGSAGVDAWKGQPDTPSVTANPNADARALLTFRLPPRSISVHPGPASGVVVGWRSPITGDVRIRGKVSDGDPAGGDGIAWMIDHRTLGGARSLASGEIDNGGAQEFVQGKDAARLDAVPVRAGEWIQLLVLPKASHTCDTTTVEFQLTDEAGGTTWDLTADVVDDLLRANPHPDRLGHAEVWRFDDMGSVGRSAAINAEELAALDLWRAAMEPGADRAAIEAAAHALQAAIRRDDATSPYWIPGPADESHLPGADRSALDAIRAELAGLRNNPPPPLDFANAAQEGGVPESPHAGNHDVRIHIRGRHDRLGDEVARGFPTILLTAAAPTIAGGSGRRELAEWLTRPEHPLTARVIVNRVWQQHFGEGIVRTASNFGKLGDRPSHPELLDHLARRFVESGWSLKALHREMVLSATYRQSSAADADTLARDPDNRWLGRMARRRLEAETLRDHLLAAAGTLDPTRGGPAIRDFNQPRRGLYVITIRSDRSTYGSLFDQADSTAPAERRINSTVAPQALFLLNHPFARAQAGTFAKRLMREIPEGDDARIGRAYELLFARPPGAEEIRVGRELVESARGEGDEAAWAAYAQVLFCTNEFLYVD